MNIPHKWLNEIIHFANGGEVECSPIKGGRDKKWLTLHLNSIYLFGDDEYEFRIKEERQFPVTSLSTDSLLNLYNEQCTLRDVANGAIKQHIIDTESKQ